MQRKRHWGVLSLISLPSPSGSMIFKGEGTERLLQPEVVVDDYWVKEELEWGLETDLTKAHFIHILNSQVINKDYIEGTPSSWYTVRAE